MPKPKRNNIFTVGDKLDVINKLKNVVDLSAVYIGDYLYDAQRFVLDKHIEPSDDMEPNAVVYIASGKQANHARVYYDGKTEPITEETYVAENIYNFLPDRFKQYKPNG